MRAVVCNELGPPSLLRVEERPDPEPRPGQVVVDVEAAGVNYVDALFVGGQYQIKPPVPFVPGTESAGRSPRWATRSTGCGSASGSWSRPAWAASPPRWRRRPRRSRRCPTSSTRHGRRRSPRATAPALYALRERARGAVRRDRARAGRRRRRRAGRHRRGAGARLPGARRGLERGQAGGGAGGGRRGGARSGGRSR